MHTHEHAHRLCERGISFFFFVLALHSHRKKDKTPAHFSPKLKALRKTSTMSSAVEVVGETSVVVDRKSGANTVASKKMLKSLGAEVAKRHAKGRKTLRDNIQGITKGAIKRLARRGGVKRMEASIHGEAQQVLKKVLTDWIRDAVMYMEHAHRKTIILRDIAHSLKHNNQTMLLTQLLHGQQA